MTDYNLPSLLVVVPLWGAFLLPFAGPLRRTLRNALFLSFSSLTVLIALSLCGIVDGGPIVYVFGPPGGATLPRVVFQIDAFGALSIFCVVILSFAGSLFSVWDTERFSGRSRYMALFLLVLAGTLGMCASGDLFTFFVALETSVIALAGLVAFWRDKPSSVEAAFKFLVSSQTAACFFLIAVGLFYGRYGTSNLAVLTASVQPGTAEKMAFGLIVCSLLFFMGAFFLPPHTWFPEACSPAPGGVGCLLLAFCQASLCALIRICYLLSPRLGLEKVAAWVLVAMGCLSMCFGALSALEEHRLKRLMGCVVVSQVGYALLSFGVGLWSLDQATIDWRPVCEGAIRGGLLQIALCALSGGLILLGSGAIYYATGTRDMDRMGGLLRNLPFSAGALFFSALLISGLPPLKGFAAKWEIVGASFALHPILAALGLFSMVLVAAVFAKVLYAVFLSAPSSRTSGVREAPYGMLAGMAFLALTILLFSLFPGWMRGVIGRALHALSDTRGYIGAVTGGYEVRSSAVGEFGYWNSFVWILFFLLLSFAVLSLRFLTHRDFKASAFQGEPCFLDKGDAEDGRDRIPASSFLSVARVFPEPLRLFLVRFQNVDASDCVGYFACSAAAIVLWLSLAG